ncbi:hypothetical protein [Pedobacter frigiditerrae]|nr:hypothetical protein [Pedobacter frigiditerrae]
MRKLAQNVKEVNIFTVSGKVGVAVFSALVAPNVTQKQLFALIIGKPV